MKWDQTCIWWPMLYSISHAQCCRLWLLARRCLILAGVPRVIGLSGAGPSRDVSGGCLQGAVSSSRPGNAAPGASFSLRQRWDIWGSIIGQQVPALNPWAWLARHHPFTAEDEMLRCDTVNMRTIHETDGVAHSVALGAKWGTGH